MGGRWEGRRLHSHFVTREGVYCNNLAEGEAREERSVPGHKNPKLMGVLSQGRLLHFGLGKRVSY